MSTLIAVDPGIKGCGLAIFGAGELQYCGYERSTSTSQDPVTRCADMAAQVALCVRRRIADLPGGKLILEFPQVYPGGRGRGDPNDLLFLAGVTCAISALLPTLSTRSVRPRAWKGQVPKAIHHTRIVQRLSEAEHARMDAWLDLVPGNLRHNALDAIGLGLWALNRST